ncbi:hypothetical protein A3768_1698 [Ralstonia solanacearum]|nr:hypothetical protein F504_1822 [Ralstonia pseudosolanacearum FQY_4]ANH32853.1 hypothetical protein A3768_1698 [Ralstonia solanacearum]
MPPARPLLAGLANTVPNTAPRHIGRRNAHLSSTGDHIRLNWIAHPTIGVTMPASL